MQSEANDSLEKDRPSLDIPGLLLIRWVSRDIDRKAKLIIRARYRVCDQALTVLLSMSEEMRFRARWEALWG